MRSDSRASDMRSNDLFVDVDSGHSLSPPPPLHAQILTAERRFCRRGESTEWPVMSSSRSGREYGLRNIDFCVVPHKVLRVSSIPCEFWYSHSTAFS